MFVVEKMHKIKTSQKMIKNYNIEWFAFFINLICYYEFFCYNNHILALKGQKWKNNILKAVSILI